MARHLQFDTHHKKATEEDLVRFERRWELRLPADCRRVLLESNGGVPSQTNEFYPVPEKFEEFWKEYNVLPNYPPGISVAVFHSLGNDQEPASVGKAMKVLTDSDQLMPNRVPIAGDGCGNEIMLSVGPADYGRVFYWDHELQREFAIADTFEEFLDGLTIPPPDPREG